MNWRFSLFYLEQKIHEFLAQFMGDEEQEGSTSDVPDEQDSLESGDSTRGH